LQFILQCAVTKTWSKQLLKLTVSVATHVWYCRVTKPARWHAKH